MTTKQISNICTHPNCKIRGTEHATCVIDEPIDVLVRIEDILRRQLKFMEDNNARMNRVAELIRHAVKKKQMEREMGMLMIKALIDEDV